MSSFIRKGRLLSVLEADATKRLSSAISSLMKWLLSTPEDVKANRILLENKNGNVSVLKKI